MFLLLSAPNFRKAVFSLITSTILTSVNCYADEQSAITEIPKLDSKNSDVEHIQILGRNQKLSKESGSTTLIDELELEKFNYDDIHRVLANVPGVNIRQEDGYGLRPNIGFRGVTPERSKKINILEDGTLIGPAPYSAPAAYYFPSVNRMTSVEVFKGPSAIKHGPNTVAGTLNMTTRSIPNSSEGQLEVGAGSNGFQKIHTFYGNSFAINEKDDVGFIVELLNSQADGFKDIDNAKNSLYDEDSGFNKTDLMAKLNYKFDTQILGIKGQQLFELKLGTADEESNETYLGLTDDDFTDTPNRRYAASQAGKMDWKHKQLQFTHHFTSKLFDITNRIYRNDFERAWRKVNGFVTTGNPILDHSLQEIIADPNGIFTQSRYLILTGQQDSNGENDELIVGTNDRTYYSQGIQSDVTLGLDLLNIEHVISAGVRFHQDKITRNHFEQNYLMLSGVMTPDDDGTYTTTQNEESTDAVSIYFEDTLKFDALEVTAGARAEMIDSEYQSLTNSADQLNKSSTTWLLSLSAFYSLNEQLGIFAGVHEGFVPASPSQAEDIKPEQSINYELGGRFNNGTTKLETTFFFNDFNNLKESCSFSTSATCVILGLVDQEYNGGEVDVYGLEFSLSSSHSLTQSIDLPWSVTYTHTGSEFKNSFNSMFELWGDISAGDPVPYLPEQQLTVNLGLSANKWQVNLLVKYIGEMHEAAGSGVALSGIKTDEYITLDLSADYDLGSLGSIYVKVDNLMDTVAIVSRRSYGARPSKPQQLFVGYKYSF